MKVVKEEILLDMGGFSSSPEYKTIRQELFDAIGHVVWPQGASNFSIHPKIDGNGVKPIKDSFITHLTKLGWISEHRLDVDATVKRPGAIDVVRSVHDNLFAVEWETGNISSSHRALNKMALGILNGKLVGGGLVLPTRKLYSYLTQRVGNFEELAPYFEVWRSLRVQRNQAGVLVVIAVEHDATSEQVDTIPKATDGRALR